LIAENVRISRIAVGVGEIVVGSEWPSCRGQSVPYQISTLTSWAVESIIHLDEPSKKSSAG
jgi:hypothetical protein